MLINEGSLELEEFEVRRVRESCWESADMEVWRGGLEREGKDGDMSPALLGRMVGLAPGCNAEFLRGEPTWPKLEGELAVLTF